MSFRGSETQASLRRRRGTATHWRRWLYLACWSCSLCLAPSSSVASPVADDSQRVNPEARLYFERGVRAFETGRFREAVELFRRADRVEPSALLSFNVAHAYERMHDDTSALAAYREYLRRLPVAQNRFEVSQRIAELELSLQRRGIQQLSVLSEPSGATLLIDGAALGVTPWTGELPPGRHVVLVRLRGYVDGEREVELPARHAVDVLLKLVESAAPAAGTPQTQAQVQPPPPAQRKPALPRVAERAQASELKAVPSWWTWALLGSSGALLLGAGAFEWSRRDLEDEARAEPRQIDYRNALEAMESRQGTARVLLGVGTAVALFGGLSLYLDLSASEQEPRTALGCAGDACQLSLRSYW